MKNEIYRIIDSFLVEAKDQNGKDRSLDRLNQDRHLAAEEIEKLFSSKFGELKEKIEGMKKNENPICDCWSTIDFHSPRCRATTMNKEPLKAYNQALSDILTLIDSMK